MGRDRLDAFHHDADLASVFIVLDAARVLAVSVSERGGGKKQMDMFVGVCSGGPQDKQRMVHWQKTKKFYRPMVGWSMNMDGAQVEAVEIGEYKLNDFGYWHWWPTEEGVAFNKLFPAASS